MMVMMMIISHLNIKHLFGQLEASKLATIRIMVLAKYKNIRLTKNIFISGVKTSLINNVFSWRCLLVTLINDVLGHIKNKKQMKKYLFK